MINLKIKTNGTVRNLTLPYPGQSIPDIIEKDSVVTVSEVSEPESLKYMEGHEWNIDLAKRAKLLNPHPTHYKYPIDKPQKQRYNSYRYTLRDIYYKLLKNGRMTNMAPKNKFTREEMVAAAVRVVQKMGAAALTAKSLAEELGTSTQPVFTCFGTMDTAKAEVYDAAEQVFDEYLTEGLKQEIPFFGIGTQYIRFAREEPELYRLLFLMRSDDRGSDAFAAMRHMQELVRPSLIDIYYIGEQEADRYFRDLWLVVHSLATLIVTGDCPYSDREIGQILTGFSVSIFKAIKEIPGFTEGTFDRDATFRSLIQGK